ncbi:MAG: EAL domain-containing protein, partial [Aestuariivirga sp.]
GSHWCSKLLGTGFSSLASLRDFPFDTLKLDRSFIALEVFDDRNGKIITSITTLAHSLGMTVVGEGIETQAQIDRLASLGCELGQGFLIGAPETAEAASARLTQMLLGRHLVTATLPDSSEAPPSNLYEPVPSLASLAPTGAPTSLLQPMFAEELPSIFAMASSTVKPKPKRSKPQRKPSRKKRR